MADVYSRKNHAWSVILTIGTVKQDSAFLPGDVGRQSRQHTDVLTNRGHSCSSAIRKFESS